MWAWIKAHKWLLAGLAAGAVLLYYLYENFSSSGSGDTSGDGTQLIGGYGNPSVGYSGGGVAMGTPSTTTGVTSTPAAAATAGVTPAATPPPGSITQGQVDPSTVAQAGYTADGRAYSNTTAPDTTGVGWTQGTQPVATFGEGGTAIPVASGDFTTPYLTRPGDPNSAEPGIFVNSKGYTSDASADFARAAGDKFKIAQSYGFQDTTHEGSIIAFASGKLAPYLQYSTENPASFAPGVQPPAPSTSNHIGATIANGLVGGSLPGGQG